MNIQHHSGRTYGMDGYLYTNLLKAKDKIQKDWDMIFVVDGPERSGKSVMAQQMAYFCDPTFCIERIAFTPKDFKQKVLSASPFQAVVYDEAFTGLHSKASMTAISRLLVQMFAEIGQKNLFIFIVMPTFFDLNRYIAIWRTRALIHVYAGDDGFERGYFAFYNSDKKKELYCDDDSRKHYKYYTVKPNFYGRFSGFHTVDEAAYKKLKALSLSAKDDAQEDSEKAKELEQLLFNRIADSSMPFKQKLEVLGMKESTFVYKLRQFRKNKEENEGLNLKQQTTNDNINTFEKSEEISQPEAKEDYQ